MLRQKLNEPATLRKCAIHKFITLVKKLMLWKFLFWNRGSTWNFWKFICILFKCKKRGNMCAQYVAHRPICAIFKPLDFLRWYTHHLTWKYLWVKPAKKEDRVCPERFICKCIRYFLHLPLFSLPVTDACVPLIMWRQLLT